MTLTIRNLQHNEMKTAISMAANAGWNPGNNDPDLFYQIDQNGFIVAVSGNNEAAGIISAVNYGTDFGFIGMHLIASGYEEHDLGAELYKAARRKTGNVNIGLNSFEHNINFYEGFGFKTAHKIFTFEGTADGNHVMPPDITSPFVLPFEDLLEFDRKIFPYDRKHFISLWLNQPGSMVLAKYVNDKYKGYGLFRPCLKGYKISPLVAENYGVGEEILLALTGHLPEGAVFYMDIPDLNKDGIRLAEKMKMKKINETVRMYNNDGVEIALNQVFSFNSFELG